MTLRMLDSIYPQNLPDGADAYLGYAGGDWPTFTELQKRFPHAHLLNMAIAADEDATGCDMEARDLTVAEVPGWVRRQQARKVWRPVVYASASRMGDCVLALTAAGIRRAQVRLLSAHYESGKHICGPKTCKTRNCPPCDGTQWRDDAPGLNGTKIDESVLLADFFGGDMPLTDADIEKIAAATTKAVWKTDGLIPAPFDSPKNPDWTGAAHLTDTGKQLRALQGQVGQLAAKAGVDTAAVIDGIIKGLDPAELADAIATSLGADVGQEVVTALQQRLAAPAGS